MQYGELRSRVTAAGHLFFDRGSYNLNLVGVRTDEDAANTFNDWMYVAFRDHRGAPVCMAFPITTDPGVKYRINPLNPRGTGIVAPGQHRGVWRVGLHKGEQPALVQVRPMPVYRDDNRDARLDRDPGTIESVLGGFNCHHASKFATSRLVDGWSAGCQVFANHLDHGVLMALCHRAALIYGDTFTYTLLTEAQFNGETH